MSVSVPRSGHLGCAASESSIVVGSAAIDLLGGMMYYHETGIPAHPRTTLIEGKLILSRKVVGDASPLLPTSPLRTIR